ncbi:MAG: T9SS type A sorting domain-containing protein [Flavobacteriales bacterium]|nr:T9SS type A sorting domain-containing protein [Flavobacteriales bacterium]
MIEHRLALLVLLGLSVPTFAQDRTSGVQGRTEKPSLDPRVAPGPANQGAPRVDLWSDDFSSPGNWVMGQTGATTLNWQIGTGLSSQGDYPTPAILSTTADNGYAMYDSDAGNNNTGSPEYAFMTNATPFSTAGYQNVIIEFQTQYRRFNNEQTYLIVSTNNTDWPTNLTPTSDISGLQNVYHVFVPGELTQGVSPGNPETRRINISASAGDQEQVWVRFLFVGVWGYTWYIDDVKVREQPAYELIMEDGFLSHTGDGEEFGRIPASQLNNTMRVGGSYLNFGYEDMTDVAVTVELRDGADNLVVGASTDPFAMAAGTDGTMDQSVNLPALSDGFYTGTFEVTAAETDSEEDQLNNSYLRRFEVTPLRYSLDGLGNHPDGYQSTTSTGSNSFLEDPDGLMLFTYYPVRQAITVYGLEVALASNTVEGGFMIASMHDTASVLADNVGDLLAEGQPTDITAEDIENGLITMLFDDPVTLSPEGYYAGVALFSNTGAGHIRVVDDLTVPQPALASMIYLPSDNTTYTNGNAFAIRLLTDPSIGMAEQRRTLDVALYPNPTNGLVTVRVPGQEVATLEVIDGLGRTLLTKRSNGNTTLDLRHLAKGMYQVRLNSATGTGVQRIVLE